MSWAGGSEDGWQGGLPALSLDRRELIQSSVALGDGESVHRLHLRLQLPDAGWFGALNITGAVVDWSWTPHFHTVSHGGRGHRVWRVVRFAGNAGSERWDFWVDVLPEHGSLQVDIAAAFGDHDGSSLFIALPGWVSASKLCTCLSTWHFL